jgi:hypothetical protein
MLLESLPLLAFCLIVTRLFSSRLYFKKKKKKKVKKKRNVVIIYSFSGAEEVR